MNIKEELLNELTECKDIDEMIAKLKANGLDIPKEELENKLKTSNCGELSDDQLEQVTGGAGIVDLLGQIIAQYGKEKMGDIIKDLFNII